MAIPCKNLIFVLCLLCVSVLRVSGNTTTDSLMNQLDYVIANRQVYLDEKKARLEELRHNLEEAEDDRQRFDVLTQLYGEFHSFNAESAYNISLRQEEVARRTGYSNLVVNALMNRANILSTTGMYHESLGIIDSIRLETLPDYLHPFYYHIKRTVYGLLADYAAFGREKERYTRLTNMYRDSIMSVNAPGTLAYVITKADMLNVGGDPAGAIRELEQFMADNELNEHDRAICAWTLSESYGKLGDRAGQKEQLLRSSISDIKSSVREYISLRQLAMLLYEEGDLDRAYNFMTIAVDDASKCNARQRIIELSNSYPMINGIYVETVRDQNHTLEWTIIIITVMSLMLLAMLLYMRKQMRRIARARRQVEEAYEQLNHLTDQLKASNAKLSEANNAIAEISELKEIYIGRYMDQCLVYIDKLDGYSKTVGKLVNSGKSDDLKKLVKSTSLIDDELRQFYEQFDRTFLSIYPSFVSDLNGLLMPEEAIVPKKEGSLNTELRIFALIRLGISDSDRIAKFLRYSLTTIYNYRTKVRNKAKGDRNRLEAEIMKIGRDVNRNTGAQQA